jgi:hypothetical protein
MKKSTNLTTGLATDDVKNHLRTAYNVQAVPRLSIDWNWNRYATVTATNTPAEDDEGFDIERFPIESIIEPLRPNKGAAKARINEAVISAGYLKQDDPRFYVSDTEDKYKYWTAPYPTNSSGVFPNHTDGITTARPRVTYATPVKANKIVIKVENTWATPKTYSVMTSASAAGALSAVGGANPAIDGATGTLTLYFNGTAWVSNKPATLVTTNIGQIEFRVSAMGPGIQRNGSVMSYRKQVGLALNTYPTTGALSSLNVISIEAHLEADLTDRLMGVSDNFDMAEKSQLYPIGTITTNQASMSLSNEDGVFNVENSTSPYYGLIEPNAEVNLEYIYTINGVQHSVKQFKMYTAGPWASGEGTTQVELEDYSKYLKEIKPNPFMVEGKTSTEIVWRVLDSVGFVDYEIQEDDLTNNTVIPVFWTSGEETVWEVLDEVAKATQTAIYFDGRGKLQVRTRDAAFKTTATMDWNLLGIQDGNNLADIIKLDSASEFEANKIDVSYKTTKWKINSAGQPAMSKVWEPDSETLTVRSSQLIRNITSTSPYLYLDQKEILIWPYKSKVQVDGEIIEYDAKQFVYYTYTVGTWSDGTPKYTNPVKKQAWITSADDYAKYNSMTPQDQRFMNYYTGAVRISERAVWNTEKRDHLVDLNGWTTRMELYGRKGTPSLRLNPAGMRQVRKESTLRINTPKAMNDPGDTFWAHCGAATASSYKAYGTRFKFNKDKASTTQTAGLAYQMSGAREQGYYIEVRTSGSLSAAERAKSDEISIFSRVAGKDTLIGRGAATAIAEGVWYDMDVYHSGSGNTQRINVFINGQLVATGTTTAATVQGESGRFGFFARGRTHIDFEYIYAIARPLTEPIDDYGFFDLKYGGIRGGQWEREHVWQMRTRRIKIRKRKWKKETYKHNLYVFDEFGPYVHEVREFDVKFDPSPVRSSYLFNTNEWFAAVPEYSSNPFGAKFVIANTGRFHAILHGEDALVYAGAGATVNQVCTVLGQNLEIADDETVTKKNEPSIRARGLIESELSSRWIQSKAMATALATWMSVHWSDGVDQATVEVFGNPLIEVGDLVDVNFPMQNMTPVTHQYFVVGVETSFENGINTSLTIRRRRPATTVS